MKKLLTLLLCTLLLGVLPERTLATHAMGGELTYTWIQGNQYLVRYTFYRDCTGIQANSVENATVSSSCDTSITTITLFPTLSSPQTVVNTCPGLLTYCNGGTLNGIQKWVYEGMVTLSTTCADWVFSTSVCCRNAAATNLSQPPAESMSLQATLDNLNAPFNSSPVFASDPVPYLYTNNLNQYNVGTVDPDNDSLVITLTDALGTSNQPCQYAIGFSGSSPVTTAAGIIVDPSTGNISLTPTQPEVDIIAVLIQEYRNGIMVGSCRRDFQTTLVNSPNHLPSLTSLIPGTTIFTQSACAGDTVSFTVHSSDIDVNDSTFITVEGGDLASIASITSFGTR
ncbi:MAG: hypothetical protein ACKO7B_03020, partial [Flavobacteriales bacterium]